MMQGGVYECDLGPVLGRELGERRNALVLSGADLHAVSKVAIVAPTSGSQPPGMHRAWHRQVADAGSWASFRQVRTVPLRVLAGSALRGVASNDELKDIRQRMVWHLLAAARTTRISVGGEDVAVRPGSLLTIDVGDGRGVADLQVVVGSCRGNGVANVFVVSDRPRPGSRLAIALDGPSGSLTVLPHQVRTVDLKCRLLSVDGILDAWSVIAMKCRFLDQTALKAD